MISSSTPNQDMKSRIRTQAFPFLVLLALLIFSCYRLGIQILSHNICIYIVSNKVLLKNIAKWFNLISTALVT